jgi:DNA-binding beta-propeller fold protein YncE
MRSLISVAVLLFMVTQPRATDDPLKLLRAIEMPRVEGRIDHMAIDATGQKLFVAALANNTIEVIDLKAGTHLKSLPGFREPTGIASVADAGVIAVANGQGDGVRTIDANDYRTVRAIPLGDDSDNVRYDAAAKRLYIGYGSGALAAASPADGAVSGRAALAGHPESFQLERSGPRIFVNVPTAAHIAVVDRATMKVTATWPVTGAASNFPMALDEAGHRLFVGCRRPAKLLIYDTATGKETGAADIVGDTDDLFYDAARKRLYVSGGEGFIDVFHVVDARQPATLTRVARVATPTGARTSLFVPEQGRLYLAVPHRGAQRSEIQVYEVRD